MDPIKELFAIKNILSPEAGRVLVSEPLSRDGYFGRSVVLLTEHNEKGSLGFILNKSTGLSINSFVSDINDENFSVHVGGPVSSNSLYFIHTLGTKIPKAVHLFDNLYWGGDFELIKKLINSGTITASHVRFFIGYSGWAKGQLNNELKTHSWLVSELKSPHIMQPNNDDLWKSAVLNNDECYKFWLNVPVNPNWN